MIDYVGFAVGDNDNVLIPEELFPTTIRDKTGAFRPNLAALLAGDDDRYVTTEPQNVYRFEYDVPPPGKDEVTLFGGPRGTTRSGYGDPGSLLRREWSGSTSNESIKRW